MRRLDQIHLSFDGSASLQSIYIQLSCRMFNLNHSTLEEVYAEVNSFVLSPFGWIRTMES